MEKCLSTIWKTMQKKKNLVFKIRKISQLAFFLKEENPEIDCVSTRHLLPLQC